MLLKLSQVLTVTQPFICTFLQFFRKCSWGVSSSFTPKRSRGIKLLPLRGSLCNPLPSHEGTKSLNIPRLFQISFDLIMFEPRLIFPWENFIFS